MVAERHPKLIDTAAGVAEAAAACRAAGWMALDTEADSLHSYFHKLCLIQVAAGDKVFVVDPLALQAAALEPLLALARDPQLPVFMHGADYDLRVLDRDLKARVAGLADTQVMAQLLGEAHTGLAALLQQELGVALDKRQQLADWGQRPLTAAMVRYAAADVLYLRPLALRLRERLEGVGRWGWAKEELQALEKVRYEAPVPDPLAFERVKGGGALKGEARDRLFTLHGWREKQAQLRDVPPFKVLGNAPLLQLAAQPPESLEEIAKVPGVGQRFAGRYGRDVLAVVRKPREAPPRLRRERGPEVSAAVKSRVKRLHAAREQVAASLAISPGLLCPRALIEELASNGLDMDRAGLKGWRRQVLESVFRPLLGDS